MPDLVAVRAALQDDDLVLAFLDVVECSLIFVAVDAAEVYGDRLAREELQPSSQARADALDRLRAAAVHLAEVQVSPAPEEDDG
jgi:hypothetical protein